MNAIRRFQACCNVESRLLARARYDCKYIVSRSIALLQYISVVQMGEMLEVLRTLARILVMMSVRLRH